MKEYEKLGEDYAYKITEPNPFPNTEAEKFWYVENKSLGIGFNAGFLKALEMAVRDCCRVMDDDSAAEIIAQVGQGEVDGNT